MGLIPVCSRINCPSESRTVPFWVPVDFPYIRIRNDVGNVVINSKIVNQYFLFCIDFIEEIRQKIRIQFISEQQNAFRCVVSAICGTTEAACASDPVCTAVCPFLALLSTSSANTPVCNETYTVLKNQIVSL